MSQQIGTEVINGDVKETELIIEGVKYKITSKRKKKVPSIDQVFSQKLKENLKKQKEEVNALKLLYKDNFEVLDDVEQKFVLHFLVRGADDASVQFSFPPEYPSDVPPTYTLVAPWVRKASLQKVKASLVQIFTENFGKCIIYLWHDSILDALKHEHQYLRANQQEKEPTPPLPPVSAKPPLNSPEIYAGNEIWDRKSCFAPYVARVYSEEDVQKVIANIEGRRKVSTAWRNTYAYRFKPAAGPAVEVGEDGGEPKAGKNLLQRLINYDANNVIVYISRRINGGLIGSDRYKHLNDAADAVLETVGLKGVPNKQTQKGHKKSKNKK